MSDDELLDELLLRWEEEYERGRELTPDELCRDTPQLIERAAQEILKLKGLRPAGGEAPIPSPSQPMGPPLPPVKAFEKLRYTPLRHHASGGLGHVFVAVDQEIGREVALKRIKELFADRPGDRARFEREAEVTGRLEHPGVVPLYGKGRDADGRPYYAMRLIRGRSLRGAVEAYYRPDKVKKDPSERALEFRGLLQSFVGACNTVAYAHSRGVVHRDLKPDNIMLGPYGETLVVDWGLAKHVGCGNAADLAENSVRPAAMPDGESSPPGEAVGTIAFMSPEQALGRKNVGPASDVFSLGATLYQLLTGRPPYHGRRALVDAAAGRFLRPREVRRDAPPALEAVCLKAMAIRPEDRYATSQELAGDVERWLADEPTEGLKAQLAQLERLATDHPTEAEYQAELARRRVSLGLVFEGMGRHADAEAIFRNAVADYEQLTSDHPGETRHRADLATTRAQLGRILRALGRGEEAAAIEQSAMADYERLRETNPHDYRTGLASVIMTMMPAVNLQPPRPAPGERVGPPKLVPARPDGRDPFAPPAETLPEGRSGIARRMEPIQARDAPPAETQPEDNILGSAASMPPQGVGEKSLVPPELPGWGRVEEMSGRLTILRELARGGSSLLWLARDEMLNRQVVIKQLTSGLGDGARFLRGAQIAAQLEHPNIAPIYGIGCRSLDKSPFIIQRYVPGSTLQQAIRNYHDRKTSYRSNPGGLGKRLRALVPWPRGTGGDGAGRAELRRLLWVFHGACRGLAFAHSRGVLHRDPKPANIMVGASVDGVIVDWGLAKILGEAEPEGRVTLNQGAEAVDTQEGAVIGTPAYMAPEMAAGRPHALDARTDVYILGAGLYELLTGRPPHVGAYVADILSALLSGTKVPRARVVAPSVPPALDLICSRAMAYRQEDRYPTVRDLGRDVEHWLASEGVRVAPINKD